MIKEDWRYTSPTRFTGLGLESAAATIKTGSLPVGITLRDLTPEAFATLLPPTHPAISALALPGECKELVVEGKVSAPLTVEILAEAHRAGAPRLKLVLAPGSALTLIESPTGPADSFLGLGLVIELGEGARLTHLRLQDAAATHSQLALLKVKQAARSSYQHLALSTGAALWRHEVEVALAGEKADCRFDAITLLCGTQHGDVTTRIRHLAPYCLSRQRIRSVLAEQATGVFQGLIHVAPHAQKTDGQQNSRALLLSDTASMNSKPELEIFADDVKCGHGSTIGALDPLALFYLQARGIPEAEARWLLIEAFVSELLDEAPEAATLAARSWLEALP